MVLTTPKGPLAHQFRGGRGYQIMKRFLFVRVACPEAILLFALRLRSETWLMSPIGTKAAMLYARAARSSARRSHPQALWSKSTQRSTVRSYFSRAPGATTS